MTDILNQHSYHPATAQTAPLHDDVRQWCIGLASMIERTVPDGMEKDEAQKALHIVRMWANMGIAVHGAPVAQEHQKRAVNVGYSRAGTPFNCPNCRDQVKANATGHINPHWQDDGYNKTGYTCTSADEMAG